MPRIRTIKPEFWTSVTIASLRPRETRLTFIGLWNFADDHGRCLDEPRLLKAAIWPLDDDITAATVVDHLDRLAAAGLIIRYTYRDRPLLQITNWYEHQKVEKPRPSRFPPFDDPVAEVSPTPPRLLPDASPGEGKGREGKGNGKGTGIGRDRTTLVEPGGSTVVARRNGKPSTALEAKERAVQIMAEVAKGAECELRAEERRDGMVDFVFAYWATATRHQNALLDQKRVVRLRRRLEENRDDVNELCYVVDGLKKDRGLMGENERGRKYDGIETIFRDRGMVEHLAELAGYKPGMIHPVVRKYTTGEQHG